MYTENCAEYEMVEAKPELPDGADDGYIEDSEMGIIYKCIKCIDENKYTLTYNSKFECSETESLSGINET